MTNRYDALVEAAIWNDDGENASVCEIADDLFILCCDSGELFLLKNFRPNAKRTERTVSGDWVHKFLNNTTLNPTVKKWG
jgi:hypothetical protein